LVVINSVRDVDLGDGSGIRLRVSTDLRMCSVEVVHKDRGLGPKDRNATLTLVSGCGLYLVDKLADRWGVEDNGGTCVWFEIDGR
jgi:hypothetical protein